MNLTRKQFSFAILGGIAALLFGGISRLFAWRGAESGPVRARFWSRADRLAG